MDRREHRHRGHLTDLAAVRLFDAVVEHLCLHEAGGEIPRSRPSCAWPDAGGARTHGVAEVPQEPGDLAFHLEVVSREDRQSARILATELPHVIRLTDRDEREKVREALRPSEEVVRIRERGVRRGHVEPAGRGW